MNAKYNYSDFHFFGIPIPQNYRLYLLADVIGTKPGEQLNSTTLGRCKVGRPPNNATAPGIDGMLSATDNALENWMQVNEEEYESDKLCYQRAMNAKRVMDLGERGPHEYSNYSLFEWSPGERIARDRSAGHYYLYLRGLHQRSEKYYLYFETNLFRIKELNDVWLIATNWRVNFSFLHTAHYKDELFTVEVDEGKSFSSEVNEGESVFGEENEGQSFTDEDESCTNGTVLRPIV